MTPTARRERGQGLALALLALLTAAATAHAGDLEAKSFDAEVTRAVHLDYLLYLPKGYDGGADAVERWPLILFLHGAGGHGTDLAKVRDGGLPKRLAAGGDLPAIVVAPQARTWWDQNLEALTALLDDVGRRYRVDADRVYLTGLSAGGSGAWALLAHQPERFAAAIPICGAGSRSDAQRLVDLPIWVFHGEKDAAQPVEESIRMVEAIQAKGGRRAKLTVYPGVEHDAWSRTYDDPAVWEWLFAQRRGNEAGGAKP